MDGGRDGDGDGDGDRNKDGNRGGGDGEVGRDRDRGMGLCLGTGTDTGGRYICMGWHLGAHGEVGYRLGTSSAGGTMAKQGRGRQGCGSLVASRDGYDIRGTGGRGRGYETGAGRGQQVLLARKLDKLVNFASYVDRIIIFLVTWKGEQGE